MVSLGARANRSKDSKVSCLLMPDDEEDDDVGDDAAATADDGGDIDGDEANVWLD